MYTFTDEIEAELEKNAVRFIELFRVDLGTVNGTPYVYYWCDRSVPDTVTFDGEEYEARVTRSSLDQLPRGKDGKATLEISNHDGLITTLLNAGVWLEHGRVSVVRQFILSGTDADVLNVGDWTNPYWHGRITELKELSLDRAVVSVEFGYLDLSKRFGRTTSSMCSAAFADGFYCPYAPATGYGRVNAAVTGTVTGATGTSLSDTGQDYGDVEIGDVVVAGNSSGGTSGIVTAKETGLLTCAAGWTHGTPEADWYYEVGTAHSTCGYTVGDCEDRGMFGPSDNVADQKLNWSRRRYFQGFVPSSEINVQVGERRWMGLKRHEYTTVPATNAGIIGEPIPIPVGTCKLSLKPAAYLEASPFTHFIFYVGEGRMGLISSIKINGNIEVDNIGPTTQGATDDALVLGGFDSPSVDTADDADAVTSGELTLAQRQSGVGILKSRAWQYGGGTTISTYKSNPRLFASANGSGISPMGCGWMRVRVESMFDDPANVNCEVEVQGGTMMLKADNATWTDKPDVAEVAFNACINRGWGGGLSVEQINLTALDAASDWCRTLVDYTQTDRTGNSLETTVGFGPYDCDSVDVTANWMFVVLAENPEIFNGWFATCNDQTNEITGFRSFYSVPKKIPMPKGYTLDVPESYQGLKGAILFFKDEWTIAPSDGNSVTIAQAAAAGFTGYSVRAMANGVLNLQEKNFDEALTEILRCANMEWFQDLGQIYFAPRSQVDTESLTTPTITDKGATRNVISGSARFMMDPPGKAPNAVSVVYCDRQAGYRRTTLLVKDTESQLERKDRFGEQIRDENKAALYLPLVDTLDHAGRVGFQIARQKGIRSDGKRNARISVEMPAHLAMKLQPILDVCALDLDGFPNWVEFGRVESIEEGRSGLVSEVTFSVYNDDDHGDDPYDFHRERIPGEVTDADGNPIVFEIESMTEVLLEGQDGTFTSAVDVEFTLPPSKKAKKCVLFWKYESERLAQAREVSALTCDYENDTNGVISGVQNTGRLIGIPYDRASETINVCAVPEYSDRSRESIVWLPTAAEAVMDDSGGIDDDDQTVVVLKPTGGTFAVGDVVLVEDERCRISSITEDTPDVSHDQWTVVRGLHGSTATAHADEKVFQKLLCSVEMEAKTLAGVTSGLSAPSDLVAIPYAYSIRLAWTNNIADEDMAQLDSFVLFWDDESFVSFDPNNAGEWPVGVTAERVGTGDSHVFYPQVAGVPDATNPRYFRLAALNRAGVYSAVTDEANATALTESTDDDDTPDPATDIVVDVDIFTNHSSGMSILVGVEATVNADSANGVEVKLRKYEGASTNVALDQDDPFTGAVWESETYRAHHPAVISITGLAFDTRYELTARVRNVYGWSNWITPFEVEWDTSQNLDVNLIPEDVPTLDAFYAWTQDDPPLGGDANIGSGMVRFGYDPGANSATSFELDIEGYAGSAPSETVELDEGDAAAAVVRGTLTVTVTGANATEDQYQGYWFRIGREGASNSLTQCLEEMKIASNTAGTGSFTITLVDHGWKIKSAGELDYWSIVEHLSRELADYSRRIPIDDPTGPSGTFKPAQPLDYYITLAEAAEYKFRARLHNVWGRGAWRYADATASGTTNSASAVSKTTGKVQTSQQSQDAIPMGHSVVFTAESATEISWASGAVYFADGTNEAVDSGSQDSLSGGTTYWVYKELGNPDPAVTATIGTAIAAGNIVLAMVIASSNASEKCTIISRWGKGSTFSAQVIACEYLSSFSADVGELTAGTITGVTIRTASSGAQINLTTANGFRAIDSSDVTRVQIPTTQDQIKFFDTAGGSQGHLRGSSVDGLVIDLATNAGAMFSVAYEGTGFLQCIPDVAGVSLPAELKFVDAHGGKITTSAEDLYIAPAGGDLRFSGASQARLYVSGAAAQQRSIIGQTAGSTRWLMNLCNTGVESGSNVGSNFQLVAYADNGTDVVGQVLFGQRSTAEVGIGTVTPDAKLDVEAATEQLRLTYTDNSVYASFTVNSDGDLIIAPTGTDLKVTGAVQITRTTEQLRLKYDADDYWTFTVSSAGAMTLAGDDSAQVLTISNPVSSKQIKATQASDWQLKLIENASDYCEFEVDGNGDLTITPSGDDIFVPSITFVYDGSHSAELLATSAGYLTLNPSHHLVLLPYDPTHYGWWSVNGDGDVVLGGYPTDAELTLTFAVVSASGDIKATGNVLIENGAVTMTGVTDTAARSSGVGTILFNDASNRNSSGFLKFYIGITEYYIPFFAAI